LNYLPESGIKAVQNKTSPGMCRIEYAIGSLKGISGNIEKSAELIQQPIAAENSISG
jgi:hypothetical protein